MRFNADYVYWEVRDAVGTVAYYRATLDLRVVQFKSPETGRWQSTSSVRVREMARKAVKERS